MKTYRINFYGRPNGAIGICWGHTETVQALTEEGAVVRLYERFEHVRVQHITIATDAGPVSVTHHAPAESKECAR